MVGANHVSLPHYQKRTGQLFHPDSSKDRCANELDGRRVWSSDGLSPSQIHRCWLASTGLLLEYAESNTAQVEYLWLGITRCIPHHQALHNFLEARQFSVLTDHKLLTFVSTHPFGPISPCTLCQLSYISQFTRDIQHVKGIANSAANALWCIEVLALSFTNTQAIDFNALAAVQWENMELHLYSVTRSLAFCEVPLPGTNTTLMCNTSTGLLHPFFPAAFHHTDFDTSTLITRSHTRVFQQPSDLLPCATSCHKWMPMCAIGPSSVFNANAPRFCCTTQ